MTRVLYKTVKVRVRWEFVSVMNDFTPSLSQLLLNADHNNRQQLLPRGDSANTTVRHLSADTSRATVV